jgi:hypothetical protein
MCGKFTRALLAHQIFLVRVLVKARFLDSETTDKKSKTVLLTTVKQQTYVENFSSLGAIAAEK